MYKHNHQCLMILNRHPLYISFFPKTHNKKLVRLFLQDR